MSSSPTETSTRSRLTKAVRRLIEILPVLIALTALFSYRAIDGLAGEVLATPLGEVVRAVPPWVNVLMLLTAFTGLAGMLWLIIVFARPATRTGMPAEATELPQVDLAGDVGRTTRLEPVSREKNLQENPIPVEPFLEDLRTMSPDSENPLQ